MSDTFLTIPFLQARYYHPGPRAKVDLVVIHTAEVAPVSTSAEALIQACARGGTNPDGTPRPASWHYAVDSDLITQSVKEADIAWHAPGANFSGIGIELATRSNTADWNDDYHTRMLLLASKIVSKICVTWGIPLKWVDTKGLLVKGRGITTHAAVSSAFKKSTHTDPGPHFPMESFIALVIDATPTMPTLPKLTS
jgi:hypothetical protein